jgi:hypothetical protein
VNIYLVLSTDEALQTKYASLLKTAPKYLGSLPVLVDPMAVHMSGAQHDELIQVMRSRIEDEERLFDHGAAVMTLLTRAMDSLDVSHLRRRAFIRYLMAEQLIVEGQFEQALLSFGNISDFQCKEHWVECAVSVLRKMLLCSTGLGRSTRYLQTAITLFSLDGASQLSVYEKEELHRDIVSIMTSTATSAEAATGAFYCKSEFGIAAHSTETPIEYALPNNYAIDLSDMNFTKMFDIKVS